MERAVALGPFVFALVGASAGICLRMYPTEFDSSIHLGESVPWMIVGGYMGLVLGKFVMIFCFRKPELIRPVGLATYALLGAAINAPLGWFVGGGYANSQMHPPQLAEWREVSHFPALGIAIAAAVGGVMGLALGGVQILFDRRKPVS